MQIANEVDLNAFNKLRRPQSPSSTAALRAQCRRGTLPGAFLIGGKWLVDLAIYDAVKSDLIETAAGDAPKHRKIDAGLDSIIREVNQKLAGPA